MNAPRTIVISAINLSEGGPLTVLQECLRSASSSIPKNFRLVALVHDRKLFKLPGIHFIEFPKSKRSWWRRLFYEYVYFKHLSTRLNPALWFSLHDTTPRVSSVRRAVYCHNPSPFYKASFREALLEPSFFLFSLLYQYLYRINIKRNDFVVVQQKWLRARFSSMIDPQKIVVSHPTISIPLDSHSFKKSNGKFVFLYPTLPRVFKNIEVLCQAIELLPADVRDTLELRITISGQENPYAKQLRRCYGHLPSIRFLGRQTRQEMNTHYADCDVVVFPSKLETWGLPITEAKAMKKPLLVADLLYARETVGTCDAVTFLPPDNPHQWSQAMAAAATNEWIFGKHVFPVVEEPFAENWHQLWHILTRGLEQQ